MQKLAVAAGLFIDISDDKDHLIEDVRIQVTQRVVDAVQNGVNDLDSIKLRYRTMWLLNDMELYGRNFAAIKNRVQYDLLPAIAWHLGNLKEKMFAQVELLFNEKI